ncbi:cytochrome P450 [Halorientalis halophila]|uniref:cytochrome P450 n=1 Tax=Halorientalis halophila TaxID=3108499 RepID=UPI0030092CEB
MATDSPQEAQSAEGDATTAEDATEAPIAPYPPNCGPPTLHIVHQMRDPLAFAERALATRDVVRLHQFGQGDIYGVGHPEHAKRVLLTDREKFRKSADFRIAFGEGLLTVEGEEWAQQRDVLQPLFTRDSVLGYADGMVEQVRRRIDRWNDGDRLELQAEFTDLALDVLFATVLGRELALDGDRELRESAEHLHGWFKPTSYFLPEWVPTPARRRFRAAKERIRTEADRLLDEAAEGAPTDPSEAEDLLSLLVGLRESGMADSAMLTDERLRDQMVTFLFAGHDTSTTTLTFACWALANNPELRERFHAEVDELDGPPTLADVDDLEVTERLVTETLRLYPPVHSLPREPTTDVVFDGYRIPANEQLLVAIRHIHRDSRFFDDPKEFRPSRWDGDLQSELHDFAYAPFGGGPRICIGRQFALLEAQLALATIGRQYDLHWLGENDADGEPPVSAEMTLRMEPGQEFLVTER